MAHATARGRPSLVPVLAPEQVARVAALVPSGTARPGPKGGQSEPQFAVVKLPQRSARPQLTTTTASSAQAKATNAHQWIVFGWAALPFALLIVVPNLPSGVHAGQVDPPPRSGATTPPLRPTPSPTRPPTARPTQPPTRPPTETSIPLPIGLRTPQPIRRWTPVPIPWPTETPTPTSIRLGRLWSDPLPTETQTPYTWGRVHLTPTPTLGPRR